MGSKVRRVALILAGGVALAAVTPALVRACPGDLDPTFGTGGWAPGTPFGLGAVNRGLALQDDGKLVVAGDQGWSWIGDLVVARYNSDGSPDTSFGTGGYVITDVGSSVDYGYDVALQSDGKIVVAGASADPSNAYRLDFAVVRYNSDGSLDPTFGVGGKVTTALSAMDERAFSVAVQADGKIVAAGYVAPAGDGGGGYFAVVRYNPDGTLDSGFDGDGAATMSVGGEARALVIQGDGKIVVGGDAPVVLPEGYHDFVVVRYNPDGSLDTGFDGDGVAVTSIDPIHDQCFAVALQSDGKIVAAGYTGGTSYWKFAVVRYNTDGSLDTDFDTDGKVTTDWGGDAFANSVVVQSDGKILVGGYAPNPGLGVARYNPDGSLDATFSGDGTTSAMLGTAYDVNYTYAARLQADGRLVAASESVLVRYLTGCGDGYADTACGEQCEDGNQASGDCCSATCQYEPDGSPCPADGIVCTLDVCDGAGSCGVYRPAAWCRTALKSVLKIDHTAAETTDNLVWKWMNGQQTNQSEFADPSATAEYTLCVYDQDGLVLSADVQPGGTCDGAPCWSALSDKGYKYKDKAAVNDGITNVLVKGSAEDKAKALVKGKGVNLPDPELPLSGDVAAQLHNSDTGLCLESTFSGSQILLNDETKGRFKAKAP